MVFAKGLTSRRGGSAGCAPVLGFPAEESGIARIRSASNCCSSQPMINTLRIALCVLAALSGAAAGEIHVRDHGAVGDGVQDDGPALRQVFAIASRAAEPTTIHFEAGQTYLVSSPGDGHGRLVRESRRLRDHP